MLFNKKKLNEYRIEHAPTHVAMIMDGNGRWATKRGLSRSIGHRYGVNNLKTIVESSIKYNVKYLTVYAFSTENWNRPKEEIDTLFNLIFDFFEKYSEDYSAHGVRVKIIGSKINVPSKVLDIFAKAEERTKDNSKLTLIFAFNYGFYEEITQCVKKIASKCVSNNLKVDDINNKLIEDHLYTKGIPNVDLLIRTSGELRLSNFLMYQAAYAELYFTPTYWPDFNDKEYLKALIEYQNRHRRFGGL